MIEVEVIEIKVKKEVSNDKTYRVVLETPDSRILALEKYIASSVVKIDFKD